MYNQARVDAAAGFFAEKIKAMLKRHRPNVITDSELALATLKALDGLGEEPKERVTALAIRVEEQLHEMWEAMQNLNGAFAEALADIDHLKGETTRLAAIVETQAHRGVTH